MSRPIIEVRNLSKHYRLGAIGATSLREEFHRYLDRLRGVPHPDAKEFWALRDVSFDVQPGEVVGVIGHNGAGKSTLLKILSRITEPTSGRARLRGRVASLLEVGTGFHPDLTGRENVYLNGAILGMTRAEVRRKFDEIVAFAEVEQFIDTPVKRYSSGMYVRLAFAVAAHLEPEILIIDEVLAVGDVNFQKKCLGKMKDISASEGRTVLFVSHHMATVVKLCSRAIFLQHGRVALASTAETAVQAYFASTRSSLAQRNADNHEPSQPARISDVWLERSGQRTDRFIFGDDKAVAVMTIEVATPITLGVELVLRDAQQHPIAFGPSGLVNNINYTLQPGRYSVRCHLPSLALAQGSYALDLILAVSGERLIDFMESGLPFSIEPTSMGTRNWNFPQSMGRGCLLWDVQFSEALPETASSKGDEA